MMPQVYQINEKPDDIVHIEQALSGKNRWDIVRGAPFGDETTAAGTKPAPTSMEWNGPSLKID